MMRPVPMPELKQPKQKEGKTTGSTNLKQMPSAHPPGTGSMCVGGVLREQGNTTSRRRPVASAQGKPRRSSPLRLQWCHNMERNPFLRCLEKRFWDERHVNLLAVLPVRTVPRACPTELGYPPCLQ